MGPIHIYRMRIYYIHMIYICIMYYAAHINLDVPRCCLLEVSCHKRITHGFINIS